MKKTIWAVMLCASAAITSCQTVRQTADTAPVDAQVRQTPAVADLDVQPQRVSKTVTWRYRLVKWGQPSLAQRKENLIYQMLDSAKADVLLEPQSHFSKFSFGPRTLTVTGYPAKLKNFRNATPADLEALKIMDEREVVKPRPQSKLRAFFGKIWPFKK